MISPLTENPAIDKKSVPEGLVVSLKLVPFMLTAKGAEFSKEPARTKIVGVFPATCKSTPYPAEKLEHNRPPRRL